MSENNLGANYSAEQEEWLKAVQTFLNKNRRYPTTQEAFAIAIALGYRKTEVCDGEENGLPSVCDGDIRAVDGPAEE